ncbi:uncharacterized protein LOC144436610 isoform X2 [Glandiceps talaboti]
MASLCTKSVLVTGCSRGIGLELIKQFVKLPNPPQHVFATCRSPENAHELKSIAEANPSVQVLRLDVDDRDSINDAASKVEQVLGENGLSLLINNAAISVNREQTIEEVDPDYMIKLYRVNTVGPLLVIKVALNMVTFNLSLELAADKILAISLHPGYVRTDMTGPQALIDTKECVEGLMTVMATRTKEHNGYHYDYKGKLIPW